MVKFNQKVTKPMSFKQKAKEEMRQVLKDLALDSKWASMKTREKNHHLLNRLRLYGWEITQDTLFDTARHLGFTVIGICIYDEGD